ncbi:hypothetical protein CsSME_00002353 [Camellia sinensis var. sinensis]
MVRSIDLKVNGICFLPDLVLSIEKLQEVQDDLDRNVRPEFYRRPSISCRGQLPFWVAKTLARKESLSLSRGMETYWMGAVATAAALQERLQQAIMNGGE